MTAPLKRFSSKSVIKSNLEVIEIALLCRYSHSLQIRRDNHDMAPQALSSARWPETALAFGFGSAALGAVLWLAFRGSELTEQQFEILRIVLALAGGGVGAVIPGFLDLNLKAGGKLALRAGGALAVFVVLYFWSPARWQPSSGGNVATISAPGGVASKEISKSPITINNNSTSTAPAK